MNPCTFDPGVAAVLDRIPVKTEEEQAASLRTGFNRFRFGFAEAGEQWTSPYNGNHFTMIGNYARMKDAKEAVEKLGVKVHPYLYGKLKRGWVVYTVEAPKI